MKHPPGSDRAARNRHLLINTIERVAVGVVVGGSILMVWWSLNRAARIQKESASLAEQVSRLGSEVELMTAQCSPSKSQEVAARYDHARGGLFSGGTELGAWQAALTEAAVPLALDASIAFAGTRTQSTGGHVLTIVRAEVELTPAEEIPSPRTTYQRVLDFLDRLTTQPQRVDLLELRLSGVSNSVSHASASIDLWAMEPESRSP
jgi:hypothetical protein